MKYIYVEINTSQSMKNCKYTSKLKLWVEFCSDFFVVNDIDIHQLNLGPFNFFLKMVENPFTKCVFWPLLSNKCMIKKIWGKFYYLQRKKGDFIDGHCIF